MGVFNRRSIPDQASPAPTPIPFRSISGSATPPPKTPTLPYSTHRNLVAAAQLVDISTAEGKTSYSRRRATSQGWQDEAWLYADVIGEINYAFTVVANALSRVRLYTAHVTDPASPPSPTDSDTEIGQASAEILSRLNSAFGGVPGLLRDAAMNLQIAGECLLVQRPSNPFSSPPQPESWDIRSVDELHVGTDGRFIIIPREDQDKSAAIPLPKGAFVARIWRPHPRYSDSSISSVRPVLDLCAELMLLNKTFRATARSRLNSGMLYLPDGLSVATSTDPDAFSDTEGEVPDPDAATPFSLVGNDLADQSDVDEFEEALLEAMTTPIADEESASAVVPLLVRGPAELGEKIRLIQFERSFDPALVERSKEVLDRIMQGLDVPKEVVKGLSSLKFATAQIVDIQLYQAHVEPLALLICDALTTVYLRPALRALDFPEDEIMQHVIWYDPSDVTTRPNKAEDAEKGYENHLLSGTAWRQAHNFTDDDAPNSTELAVRMLIEKGQITPELAESLLTVMAPEVMQAVREASLGSSPTPLPGDVSNILNGGQPAPAAPAEEAAPPEAAPTDVPAEAPVDQPAEEEPVPEDPNAPVEVLNEEDLV